MPTKVIIYSLLIDMLIIQNPRKRSILNLQLSVLSPRHSERAAFCLIRWLLLWTIYLSLIDFPVSPLSRTHTHKSLSNNSSLLLLSRHLNRIVNIWKFRTFSLDFFCSHSVIRCGSRDFFPWRRFQRVLFLWGVGWMSGSSPFYSIYTYISHCR